MPESHAQSRPLSLSSILSNSTSALYVFSHLQATFFLTRSCTCKDSSKPSKRSRCFKALQSQTEKRVLSQQDLLTRVNWLPYFRVWMTTTCFGVLCPWSDTCDEFCLNFMHVPENIFNHWLELPSVFASMRPESRNEISVRMLFLLRPTEPCISGLSHSCAPVETTTKLIHPSFTCDKLAGHLFFIFQSSLIMQLRAFSLSCGLGEFWHEGEDSGVFWQIIKLSSWVWAIQPCGFARLFQPLSRSQETRHSDCNSDEEELFVQHIAECILPRKQGTAVLELFKWRKKKIDEGCVYWGHKCIAPGW